MLMQPKSFALTTLSCTEVTSMKTRKIYKVQMKDNTFRFYDERSRISELADLPVKEIYPIETGISYSANTRKQGLLLEILKFVLIVLGAFGTLPNLSSSQISANSALAPQPPNQIVVSTNRCSKTISPLKRFMCYQGYRRSQVIKRSQIPLDATRVRIDGLPKLVVFKDGDILLIVY